MRRAGFMDLLEQLPKEKSHIASCFRRLDLCGVHAIFVSFEICASQWSVSFAYRNPAKPRHANTQCNFLLVSIHSLCSNVRLGLCKSVGGKHRDEKHESSSLSISRQKPKPYKTNGKGLEKEIMVKYKRKSNGPLERTLHDSHPIRFQGTRSVSSIGVGSVEGNT
jgi:hypothetical protein